MDGSKSVTDTTDYIGKMYVVERRVAWTEAGL